MASPGRRNGAPALVPVALVSSVTPAAPTPTAAPAAPRQAETDAQLLELWLFGRSPHTVRAYRREAAAYLVFLGARGRGLTTATLGDLQAYADGLGGLAPASRQRALAAVKSLLTFGHRIGYLPVNVGAAVKLPPARDALAERLLARERVTRLIALEPDARNRALLLVLYVGGLRISEAVALRWRDLRPRDYEPGAGGQLAVQGKGGRPATSCCRSPCGGGGRRLRPRPTGTDGWPTLEDATRRCSAASAAPARWTCARRPGWSRQRRGGRGCPRAPRPTGCATPTPRTP